MKITLGLILALTIAVGAGGYWLTDKVVYWEASALYTVVPKVSGASPNGAPSGLAYTDIQAANLFIDTMRSWLLNPSIQKELAQAHPKADLTGLPRLSMQTFSLQVVGEDEESARQGLLQADVILQRELARYNGSGEMTQFSAYRTDVAVQSTTKNPWWNAALSGLITLVVASFLCLLINYYRRSYAHRS